MNQKAMYQLTYGLFVLSAKDGEKNNGCIINTVQQVTTTPNRITIAVNKMNYTHDIIENTGEFNVSVLDQSAPFSLFQNFGFQSGIEADKFKNVNYAICENGLIYLPENTAAFCHAWP